MVWQALDGFQYRIPAARRSWPTGTRGRPTRRSKAAGSIRPDMRPRRHWSRGHVPSSTPGGFAPSSSLKTQLGQPGLRCALPDPGAGPAARHGAGRRGLDRRGRRSGCVAVAGNGVRSPTRGDSLRPSGVEGQTSRHLSDPSRRAPAPYDDAEPKKMYGVFGARGRGPSPRVCSSGAWRTSTSPGNDRCHASQQKSTSSCSPSSVCSSWSPSRWSPSPWEEHAAEGRSDGIHRTRRAARSPDVRDVQLPHPGHQPGSGRSMATVPAAGGGSFVDTVTQQPFVPRGAHYVRLATVQLGVELHRLHELRLRRRHRT